MYSRVSKGGSQEDEKGTLPRQEQDCRKLAELRGWNVIEVIREADTSAWSGVERPGFERALRMLNSNEADVLVIWKLDRLARVLADWDRVVRTGKQVASVNDSLDTTTATGRFTSDILVRVHQLASEETSLRTKRAKRASAEAGDAPHGGRRAFGLTDDWKDYVKTEKEAIAHVARMVVDGAPLAECVRWLEDAGHAPPGGNRWSSSNLAKMLLNPRIVGDRTYLGDVVAVDAFPPMLDRRTWAMVCETLSDPGRWSGPTGDISLLSGVARCGSCGARMRASGPRYRCRPSVGCGAVTCDRGALDELVADLAVVASSRWPDLRRSSELEAEEATLQARIDRLAEMLGSGDLTPEEWTVARRPAMARLLVVRREVDAARTPVLNSTRAVVLSRIDAVYVAPVGRGWKDGLDGRVWVQYKGRRAPELPLRVPFEHEEGDVEPPDDVETYE